MYSNKKNLLTAICLLLFSTSLYSNLTNYTFNYSDANKAITDAKSLSDLLERANIQLKLLLYVLDRTSFREFPEDLFCKSLNNLSAPKVKNRIATPTVAGKYDANKTILIEYTMQHLLDLLYIDKKKEVGSDWPTVRNAIEFIIVALSSLSNISCSPYTAQKLVTLKTAQEALKSSNTVFKNILPALPSTIPSIEERYNQVIYSEIYNQYAPPPKLELFGKVTVK